MSETQWSWACVPGHAAIEQPRNRDERKALVFKLRAQGEPIGVIARVVGLNRNTVVGYLQSAPSPPSPPTPRHPEFRSLGHHARWSPQRDRAALRMLNENVSVPEIAVSLGVSTGTLRRRLEAIAPDWQGKDADVAVKAKEPKTFENPVEIRPALPAGSPISWGALIRGTCLEGLEWPGDDAG